MATIARALVMIEAKDHFKAGYHYQEHSQWLKATEEFSKVEPNRPDYVLAQCGLAYCLLKNGNYVSAVTICVGLIESCSKEKLQEKLWLQYPDENPYIIAAYALIQLGNLDGAASMLCMFDGYPSEVINMFFERNLSSPMWKEICRSNIKSPLTSRER